MEANFASADLTGCRIYGVSAWGLKLERVKQQNLIITPEGEPKITVDNIEVAQFIYLMLHNQKIRDVIDTITSKAVLILGRFTGGGAPTCGQLTRWFNHHSEKDRARLGDWILGFFTGVETQMVDEPAFAKSTGVEMHDLQILKSTRGTNRKCRHEPLDRRHPQCTRSLRHRAGPRRRLCGADLARRTALSLMPAAARSVLDVGDWAYPEYSLRSASPSLCAFVARRRRGRRRVCTPNSSAHHARRCGIRQRASRLSLLYVGVHRIFRSHRPDRRHAAVRRSVARRCRGTTRWTLRAWRGVAGGRPTAINVISTLLECGFGACADNPTFYENFSGGSLSPPPGTARY